MKLRLKSHVLLFYGGLRLRYTSCKLNTIGDLHHSAQNATICSIQFLPHTTHYGYETANLGQPRR